MKKIVNSSLKLSHTYTPTTHIHEHIIYICTYKTYTDQMYVVRKASHDVFTQATSLKQEGRLPTPFSAHVQTWYMNFVAAHIN